MRRSWMGCKSQDLRHGATCSELRLCFGGRGDGASHGIEAKGVGREKVFDNSKADCPRGRSKLDCCFRGLGVTFALECRCCRGRRGSDARRRPDGDGSERLLGLDCGLTTTQAFSL